jgi:hypothetical protein
MLQIVGARTLLEASQQGGQSVACNARTVKIETLQIRQDTLPKQGPHGM